MLIRSEVDVSLDCRRGLVRGLGVVLDQLRMILDEPRYRQRRAEIVGIFLHRSQVPTEQIAALTQGLRFSIEVIELVDDGCRDISTKPRGAGARSQPVQGKERPEAAFRESA